MTDCPIKAFNGCSCPEGQCLESKTVRIPTPPPFIAPNWRMFVAALAWGAMVTLISYTAFQLHQEEKRLEMAARV